MKYCTNLFRSSLTHSYNKLVIFFPLHTDKVLRFKHFTWISFVLFFLTQSNFSKTWVMIVFDHTHTPIQSDYISLYRDERFMHEEMRDFKTYDGSDSSVCRKYLLHTSGLFGTGWAESVPGESRKLRLVALEMGTEGRELFDCVTALAVKRCIRCREI